ncbi:MAG: high-potential iron-sulfur protein [Halobacteria archaeon]|nr:high-potential iron-sulfur protein [Halobacteria archaeon]
MDRRDFLKAAGATSIAGLAGCTGGGGGGGSGGDTGGNGGGGSSGGSSGSTGGNESGGSSGGSSGGGTSGLPEGVSQKQFDTGPVPKSERTATSQGGTKRNPKVLQAKSAVGYQSHPSSGQQCNGCVQYIPDKNGDGYGACALVQGYINPTGYCSLYAAYQG